jgi:predicted nucleic acid-binding protein
MSHLLDTNICAAHFRRPAGLAHRFIQYGGGLFLPTVVLAELYAGAYHVADPAPLLQKVADLLQDVHVLPFDEDPSYIAISVFSRRTSKRRWYTPRWWPVSGSTSFLMQRNEPRRRREPPNQEHGPIQRPYPIRRIEQCRPSVFGKPSPASPT